MATLPFFSALDQALFPALCAVCDTPLRCEAQLLCPYCRARLPYFDNRSLAHNCITAIRSPRLPIAYGAALLEFQKDRPVQRIIHRLKYHNWVEISRILGLWLGARLRHRPLAHYHYTLPVPLHWKKREKRGYNQVSGFARALACELGLRAREDLLLRLYDDETQTRKSPSARRLNVRGGFIVLNCEALRDKRVLLVDDVMTTGATLKACTRALLRARLGEGDLAVMAVAR